MQMPNLEVWLQRPTDIVRKLCSGDLDLGIVGYDIISEIGHVSFWGITLNLSTQFVHTFSFLWVSFEDFLLQGNDDLVIIHDALDFGHCHLSLAVWSCPSAVTSTTFTIPLMKLMWTSQIVLCDQVPQEGIFQNINTLEELVNMPHWTEERPMRVVTGFGYVWSWIT